MKKFKRLTPKQKDSVESEVKLMLAAHRDFLWGRHLGGDKKINPTEVEVAVNEGYYGEAFGVMRGVNAMGFGYFGSDNLDAFEEERSNSPHDNLKWWFRQIVNQYLVEEGYYDQTCSPERANTLLKRYRDEVRK